MFCAYIRPRYQVSVYRAIGPLVKNMPEQKLWASMLPFCLHIFEELVCFKAILVE